MKRELSTAVIAFSDGSNVSWRYLGKQMRLYKLEKRYSIHVRIENAPNSIDQYFESWDKPSEACAAHFIKNAIKDAKESNLPIK